LAFLGRELAQTNVKVRNFTLEVHEQLFAVIPALPPDKLLIKSFFGEGGFNLGHGALRVALCNDHLTRGEDLHADVFELSLDQAHELGENISTRLLRLHEDLRILLHIPRVEGLDALAVPLFAVELGHGRREHESEKREEGFLLDCPVHRK